MNDTKYIGLDVHQATISAVVLDSTGRLVMESILETKAATILQFIHGLRGSLHVTFEEGTCAAWLHDLLKPHVTQVLVCDPEGSLQKLGDSVRGRASLRAPPSERMAGQDHRSRRTPPGGVLLPATRRVAVDPPAGSTGSVGGEQEAQRSEFAAPDSFDRSDPCGPVDRPDSDAAPFSYEAATLGLQRPGFEDFHQRRTPRSARTSQTLQEASGDTRAQSESQS